MTAPDTYRQQLLAPLLRTPPRSSRAEAPPTRVWFKPEAPLKPVSLEDLYKTGVECGHGETRAYLRSRIGSFDRELEHARALTQDALRQIERLVVERRLMVDEQRRLDRQMRERDSAVDQARARIAELESSTFWRLTLPLRLTVHQAKKGVRWLGSARRHARLLRPRLVTARQIARDQGVVELLRRVRTKVKARPKGSRLRKREGLAAGITPLHVPSSETPLVTVIVPTYGQDLHTFTCLKAVAVEAANVPLEVIVADDCAPVPAAQALGEVTGVRFERNETNLGFLLNCNRAASSARGGYILFLNNDAVLAPGAIRTLVDTFARFPAAGAVGGKLVFPDGRLQEAGAIVWRDGSAWNVGRGEDPARPEYNYVRDVDYCSAACLLVPRELFASLGGFDERYVPAYCEDTDLCLAIRASGRRVLYQPAAEAVHFEGVSHGTDIGAGVKQYQADNQRKLRDRWQQLLASHRANGSLPSLERDRGATRRVLLVEACMLTPDQDSGSMRTWRLIEVMQEMGCKVTFVADNLEGREPYVVRLQQAGVEVLYAPFVNSVESIIVERGADYDVIIMARYYVAGRYLDAVRRHAPRALVVFDTIDLHYLRQRRLAVLEGSQSLAQSAQAIYREEIDCVRRADVTWVVSDVEATLLAEEVPGARILVQSNVHDVMRVATPFAEREGLLFVGGFRHPPNVDAVLWYSREIAPLLAELLPGITTYVIGSNAPRAILDIVAPGMEMLGYVPDIEPWLDRCRVSVSPLRYGAGVKGKVNQSMSHGVPVVATAVSVEGMHLVSGEGVLVADTPQEFAAAVARAYHDEVLWNRLSREGRSNIERHFSRAVARERLARVFERADSSNAR